MTDWTGIRERVLALAGSPGGDRVFGAAGHGFALDAPLTAAELAEAEEWLGVELPEDYRSFLLLVGTGGAGPDYGLFPLRRDGAGGWHWVGDVPEEVAPGTLTGLFPGGADPLATARTLAARPLREEYEDLADLDAALELWEEERAQVQYDPQGTAGALCLGDEGCGLTAWLVVSGPERGRMWRDPRSDGHDLHPLRDTDGTPLDFAAWYLGWLAAAEAACAPDRPDRG
ncbi:SMI1/KNR4 family protein [Kitasatospora sp. NPDC048365]|uniref:SMI1/KNR4 family protein n=1 Tax=Kitasatospora sp. NPDC048365 TaxID=3364050 RepID=UPI00371ED464